MKSEKEIRSLYRQAVLQLQMLEREDEQVRELIPEGLIDPTDVAALRTCIEVTHWVLGDYGISG